MGCNSGRPAVNDRTQRTPRRQCPHPALKKLSSFKEFGHGCSRFLSIVAINVDGIRAFICKGALWDLFVMLGPMVSDSQYFLTISAIIDSVSDIFQHPSHRYGVSNRASPSRRRIGTDRLSTSSSVTRRDVWRLASTICSSRRASSTS